MCILLFNDIFQPPIMQLACQIKPKSAIRAGRISYHKWLHALKPLACLSIPCFFQEIWLFLSVILGLLARKVLLLSDKNKKVRLSRLSSLKNRYSCRLLWKVSPYMTDFPRDSDKFLWLNERMFKRISFLIAVRQFYPRDENFVSARWDYFLNTMRQNLCKF